MFDCRQTLYELSRHLSQRFGAPISRDWISRMFKRWRWSFKKISHKHIRKFLWPNIYYYAHYLVHVQNMQMGRIKFVDEASFSSRGEHIIMHRQTAMMLLSHKRWLLCFAILSAAYDVHHGYSLHVLCCMRCFPCEN